MDAHPDQKSVERFHRLLKKMFPVEEFEVNEAGFCWQFFRPDPDVYRRLRQILESIPGPPFWSLSSWRDGSCLAPYRIRRCMVAPFWYPPVAATMFDLVQLTLSEGIVSERIPDQLDWSSVEDVILLIERELHLENAQPQEFAQNLWSPELHKDQKEFRDFIEDGYQEIWLAKEPETLDFSWPSDNSLPLSFGLKYEEWKSIFVLELGATRLRMIENGPGDPFPYASDDEFPEYPLLSRLKDTNETARYAAEEVSDFKDECLTLAQRTKSQTSVRGLDKLVIATSWAGHLGYGMVFIDTE